MLRRRRGPLWEVEAELEGDAAPLRACPEAEVRERLLEARGGEQRHGLW